MRFLLMFLTVVLVPSMLFAEPGVVRPIDHSSAVTLQRGTAKSPLIRGLIRDLEQTDAIVHVEMSRHLPAGIGGTTRFVASRGGHRYLRVTLSSALPPDARIAMLGHELQHVVEIAQSAAIDLDGLEQMWRQRGYKISGTYFETDAALRVERAIRKELRAPASQAQPAAEPGRDQR
jgi:hypothetical protein